MRIDLSDEPKKAQRAAVWLDGRRVEDLVDMADEERGEVSMFRPGVDGRLLIVNGELPRDLVRGEVHIGDLR